MISVRNVVSVDFDLITTEKTLGGFDTTVYFTNASLVKNGESLNYLLIENVNELAEHVQASDNAIMVSARNYFENGGVRLLFVKPELFTLEAFQSDIEKARKLTSDFIYVAIQNGLVGASGYTSDVLQSIANYCDESKSPNKIRLLLTATSKNFIAANVLQDSMAVVKYCSKTVGNSVIDAALLVGAYFSKINLDGENTIKDYSYTKEKLIGIDQASAAEDISQVEFEEMVNGATDNGHYNVIDNIGSHTVNFGGDLAANNRISIHTDFGAIAVERDVTYSVLEAMIGKQYLTEQGMSNVKAAIDNRLQRYKTNGYLNLGARYGGEDLSIKYNGKTYNVISAGTTLPQGFYIFSVPVADISAADRLARKFTPLYVILETQSGARVIEITGEVRS